MKKAIILLITVVVLVCGCGNNKASTQNETTSETKEKNVYEKLVLKDGDIISGRESWEKFFREATIAKDAGMDSLKKEIEIDYIWTEDKQQKREAATYETILRLENGKYVYEDFTENETYTYEYLIKRCDKEGSERGYFLVNDKSVTYDDLMWSLVSSQSTDWIEHEILFFDYTE